HACDEPATDRIGHLHEHDRDGTGFSRQQRQERIAHDQDHIGRERDNLIRRRLNALGVADSVSKLNLNVLIDVPAESPQSLSERGHPDPPFWVLLGESGKHTQSSHALGGLLRARRARPRGRRAAESQDELAPPDHSITLSARASNSGGISTPSALAALRLMARSNLVGCSTGSSLGFAPLSILCT